MARPVLCVFVKPPIPGEAKTRLIPTLGAAGAARLAQAFLVDTLSTAVRLGWPRLVVAATGPVEGVLEPPPGVEVWQQGEGDLGDRMERVLREALRASDRAIVIGTDSPGLPPAHLDFAREALDGHDAVFGPTDDGGFHLIGLRRCPRGLLTGLPWSRSDTLRRTETRVGERGLTSARGPRWFDVDRPEDVDRIRDLARLGTLEAPATVAALRELDEERGRGAA